MRTLFSRIFLALFGILFLAPNFSNAQQVSPYSLTPEWRFGANSGLSFPSGNFPLSGTPTSTPASANTGSAFPEASTSICDKSGAIALYSNTLDVRNMLNAVVTTFSVCSGSATGGAVAIPDPASPSDTYYLFLANDITKGCSPSGITYYKFKKNISGVVTLVSSFPAIIPGNWADESITASTDGLGNYWIISHNQSSNTFRAIKVDQTGVIAPTTDQTKTPSTPNVSGTQSYSKISPCQNKIAWSGGGTIVIYEFDRTSGTIGNLLKTYNVVLHGVGLEFSPDGNIIYWSGQGTTVGWFDMVNNTSGSISGSNSWSMQLGPDGNIYTSGTQSSTVAGVISTPNTPSTSSYTTISLAGSMFRGISNIAWLNPEAPLIKSTVASCTVDFDHEFLNYFQTAIGVDPTSYKWTFGDPTSGASNTSTSATPSHTFTGDGTYTVTLEFKDATCGHTFTAKKDVTVSCGIITPPPTCNLNLVAQISPVADFVLSENDPYVLTLDGSGSSGFDNASSDPKKFYWMFDSPDTTTAFAKTDINGLNDKTSRTFQHGTALQEGTYHVFLVIRQGICLDTTSITFTVTHSTVPVCNFDLIPVIKQVDDVLIDENNSVTINFDGTSSIFNPSNIDPELSYWILGSNDTTLAFSKNPTSSLTFAFNGKGGSLPQGPYDVTLVIREGLCMDSTKKVHFNVTFFFLTNLVTPNGDGKNDKFYITNTSGRFDVEVFNRWGQRVFKQNGYTDGWDLSSVSDGIYYYEVIDTKTSKSYKSWVNVVSK